MAYLRLSVVLCTFNGARWLPEQLDSLLSQRRQPDEIVMADDVSSDDTWEVLSHFKARAEGVGVPVRLHRNTRNLGYIGNFSAALERASGDVLFLCDQDDVWCPDKLEKMAARFERESDLMLLHSNARLVGEQGEPLGYSLFEALELTPAELHAIHDGRAFDVALRRSFVTGATAALRRDALASSLPVAEGWVHDEWLTVVVAARGRIDCLEEPLIDYRQHGNNQIGMRKRTWVIKCRELSCSRGAQLIAQINALRGLEEYIGSSSHLYGKDKIEGVRDKRVHFERRVALGRQPRYRRWIGVLLEACGGGYRRYGTGLRSILRDVLRNG